jgi:uncharacterized protein (DUF2141 family)
MLALTLLLMAASPLASHPDLGKAEGRCTADSGHPRFIIDVAGLKDRIGKLKLELYPAKDGDFLADDNKLLSAGKAFARVEQVLESDGPVSICIRAPRPGRYALSLLHDRNGDRRFTLSRDGIGFAGNPTLHMSKPKAADASAFVSKGASRITIILNYRSGLFSFAPLSR